MANIIGNQNPKIGETNYYTLNSLTTLLSYGVEYEWYLYKKQKNNSWKDITSPVKKGNKVPYTFFEVCLNIEMKIEVYEIRNDILSKKQISKKKIGDYIVIPTNNKTPKINKVVLLNRGAKDINKASYQDTLTAQAHCVGLFNQEIEFSLWEDDAKGNGHNANVNKNNKAPRTYKSTVNKNGIAEVKISLAADERILRQIANKYMMQGDTSEGANHEYYVTASYNGSIKGASQVNVNVQNPDAGNKSPAKPKAPSPDSYKKPLPNKNPNPSQNDKPDKSGKIIDVKFKNKFGKAFTTTPKFGETIIIEINTVNCIGKRYNLHVWEHDTFGKNDLLYSGNHKISKDSQLVSYVLTKERQQIGEIGNDKNNRDSGEYTGEFTDHQEIFAEIVFADLTEKSETLTVEVLEAYKYQEPAKSPAQVKQVATQKPKEGECFCNRDLTSKEFEKIIHGLRDNEPSVKKEIGYSLFSASNCKIKEEDKTI